MCYNFILLKIILENCINFLQYASIYSIDYNQEMFVIMPFYNIKESQAATRQKPPNGVTKA